MSRILKLSFFYKFYLQWFYVRNDVQFSSYQQHLKLILNDRFSWSDSFKEVYDSISSDGVEEIIANDEHLQKKWALQYSKKKIDDNWNLIILEEQIKFYKPQIIIVDQPNLEETYYLLFKKYNTQIITYDGIASHNKYLLKYSDLVFTCLKNSRDFYENFNKKSYYMPHGFDARLSNLTNSEKKIELGFIGNILNKNHSSRVEILNHIIKHYPINLWIGDLNKQNKISPTNLFSKDYFNIKSFNKIINRLITYAKLGEIKKNNQGAVFGIEMYSKLASTLIALNTHISTAGDEAANIRMFESTGLGCCLLTDKKNNIIDFFSEDEVLVYDDKYDAIEKIKYLFNNPDIAKKMGQKSMLKTLKFHTVQIRWKKFIEYLNLNF